MKKCVGYLGAFWWLCSGAYVFADPQEFGKKYPQFICVAGGKEHGKDIICKEIEGILPPENSKNTFKAVTEFIPPPFPLSADKFYEDDPDATRDTGSPPERVETPINIPDVHAAAIKIQANLARKKFTQLKNEQEALERQRQEEAERLRREQEESRLAQEQAEKEAAAITIQSHVKGHLTRKQLKEEQERARLEADRLKREQEENARQERERAEAEALLRQEQEELARLEAEKARLEQERREKIYELARKQQEAADRQKEEARRREEQEELEAAERERLARLAQDEADGRAKKPTPLPRNLPKTQGKTSDEEASRIVAEQTRHPQENSLFSIPEEEEPVEELEEFIETTPPEQVILTEVVTEEAPLVGAPLQTEQPVEPEPVRVFHLNRVRRNNLQETPTNDPNRLFFTAQEKYNHPKSTKRQGLPKKYQQQFSVSFSEDFPLEKRQKLAKFLVNTQPSFLHRPELHINKLDKTDLSTPKRTALRVIERALLKPANTTWRKLGAPLQKATEIGMQDPTHIPNLSGAAFKVLPDGKIDVIHYYANTKENRGWSHKGIIELNPDEKGKPTNPHVRYSRFNEEEKNRLDQFQTAAQEYFRETPPLEIMAEESPENSIAEDAASISDAEPENAEEETAVNAQETQKNSTAEDDDTLSPSKGKGKVRNTLKNRGSRASTSQPKEAAPPQTPKPQVISLKADKTPGKLVFEEGSNPDALKYTRTYNGRDPQKYFVYQATTAGSSDKATSLASRALYTLMSNEPKLTQKFGTGRVTSVAVRFTGPQKAEVTFVAQKGRNLGGSAGGGQQVKGTLSLEQKTPKLTFQTSEETLLVNLDRKLAEEYQETVNPKPASDTTPAPSPAPEQGESQNAEESAAQTPSPLSDTGVSETEPETSPAEEEQPSGEETETEQESLREPARADSEIDSEALEAAARKAAIIERLKRVGAIDPFGPSASHRTIPQTSKMTEAEVGSAGNASSAKSDKPKPAPRSAYQNTSEGPSSLEAPVVATEGPLPEMSAGETGEGIPNVELTNELANNDGEHAESLNTEEICGTERVPESVSAPNEGIIVQSGDVSGDANNPQSTPNGSSQEQHDSSGIQPSEDPGNENATFESGEQAAPQDVDSLSFDSPTATPAEVTFTTEAGDAGTTSFVADTGGASSGISGGEPNGSTDSFSGDAPGGGGLDNNTPNGGGNDNSAPETSAAAEAPSTPAPIAGEPTA